MLSAPTRLLRDRRLVVGSVAVLLVGALLVAVGHWDDPDPQAAAPVADRAGSRCADVLVVGVNGNAEHHGYGQAYGKTVNAVVSRVVARAEAHGRRVAVRSVALRTQKPNAVLRDRHTATSHTVAVLSKGKVRHWRSAVIGGVRDTRRLVAAASAACPDRPVLLVGYAQGAAVVHRVLVRAAAEGVLARLVGGVLVSDPDRVGRSVAHPVLGDPAALRRHHGLFPQVLRSISDVPAPRGSYAVWSVCTRHDLVCDPSRAGVRASITAARSYVALARGAGRRQGRVAPAGPVAGPESPQPGPHRRGRRDSAPSSSPSRQGPAAGSPGPKPSASPVASASPRPASCPVRRPSPAPIGSPTAPATPSRSRPATRDRSW